MSDHGDYAGWTAEKPTEAGWYWIRDGGYTNVVYLSLHEDSDGMGPRLCVEVGPDDLLPLEEYELRVQWLGPITPYDRQHGRADGLREASRKASDAASLLLNTHSSFANVVADALMDFSDILSQDARRIEQAAQGVKSEGG